MPHDTRIPDEWKPLYEKMQEEREQDNAAHHAIQRPSGSRLLLFLLLTVIVELAWICIFQRIQVLPVVLLGFMLFRKELTALLRHRWTFALVYTCIIFVPWYGTQRYVWGAGMEPSNIAPLTLLSPVRLPPDNAIIQSQEAAREHMIKRAELLTHAEDAEHKGRMIHLVLLIGLPFTVWSAWSDRVRTRAIGLLLATCALLLCVPLASSINLHILDYDFGDFSGKGQLLWGFWMAAALVIFGVFDGVRLIQDPEITGSPRDRGDIGIGLVLMGVFCLMALAVFGEMLLNSMPQRAEPVYQPTKSPIQIQDRPSGTELTESPS